ncbi:MAG: hypothetical protein A2Z35_06120 [Actinobacteria bacterium RBG_19FT_COMBO_36_27]|nr:MAG: hypothetical protein A2Z35_06120 [Actinobacteria bacterium RBG_19FT_COMBO_36_27]
MTNANKKRYRRGDPIIYKGLPTQLGCSANIIYYCLTNKRGVYSFTNRSLNETECKNTKRIYLKAVKNVRKEYPDIRFDDIKIIREMVKIKNNEGLKSIADDLS